MNLWSNHLPNTLVNACESILVWRNDLGWTQMRGVTPWGEKNLSLQKGLLVCHSTHPKYQDRCPFRVNKMPGIGRGITDLITMVLFGAFTAHQVLPRVLHKLIQLIHMTIFLGATPPISWSLPSRSSASSLKPWRNWGWLPRSCRSPDGWIAAQFT